MTRAGSGQANAAARQRQLDAELADSGQLSGDERRSLAKGEVNPPVVAKTPVHMETVTLSFRVWNGVDDAPTKTETIEIPRCGSRTFILDWAKEWAKEKQLQAGTIVVVTIGGQTYSVDVD